MWEFVPQWIFGMGCNIFLLSASEGRRALTPLCCWWSVCSPWTVDAFFCSFSQPPCVYIFTFVTELMHVFVLNHSMHAFICLCVCVFQPNLVPLSRSGCDTVATNYRSGRLKPGEKWAHQNLPWNSSSAPHLFALLIIFLFINLSLPLGHLRPLSASHWLIIRHVIKF